MNVKLIDTHCHITCDTLFKDVEGILSRARGAGVVRMLVVCCERHEFERAQVLAQANDDIDVAFGFHPQDADRIEEGDLQFLKEAIEAKKVQVLGEIGLDYHREKPSASKQMECFHQQMKIAREFGIPVAIHMRDATSDTLHVLAEYQDVIGIMHCYSGSAETCVQLLAMGYYISFSGVLTFKNAQKVVESAMVVPIDRLLVETDCPFLTPHPHRGKPNEVMYVRYTFAKLAEIKGIDQESLALQMVENYQRLLKQN